jgi:hypothetical protein
VKCSDEPLTVDEFELLCERLRGRFPAIPDASWYLVQLGVNVDIPNLRIDGFQSLSLSAFENGFLQVYEKNRGTTRVEAHFLPSLELQDVIQTLLKLLPSGERQ